MIKNIEIDDLKKIVAIGKKCLPIYYDMYNLLFLLKNPDFLMLKNCIDNEIFGFLIARLDKNEKNIHIISLGISEKYRRKGLATDFINYLKFFDKYCSISLFVIDSNITAQKFYIKNGFKKINVLKKYYSSLNNADAFQYKFFK